MCLTKYSRINYTSSAKKSKASLTLLLPSYIRSFLPLVSIIKLP
ncbi:hypothetical protein [Francisella tularensis]|nr:hypothetical protein [Francisella tularensis]